MKKKLTFLGIETSCDETAAAVVEENLDGTGKIHSNVILSQVNDHKKFGGVVPEIAARSHLSNIEYVVDRAIKESGKSITEINAIAGTAGPGLIVCLTVGLSISKSIAAFLSKPFYAINHLEGHALSPSIKKKLKFPYLLLLISGGHSQFLLVNNVNDYKQLGTTIDDALGEAFDKTAKMLGLPYPGGKELEDLAKNGDEDFCKLPLPIINKGGCNMSFAGLKTAVMKEIKKIESNKDNRKHIAASFQKTINEILFRKSDVAMKKFREVTNININKQVEFVVAGGVAANEKIRNNLKKLCKINNFTITFPDKILCGDNAAMIAWAGIQRSKKNLKNDLDFLAKPKWPLDDNAPFMKGPGLKL